MSYAIEISHHGDSMIISFQGDTDEFAVARIVTAIDAARVAGRVLIDLTSATRPHETAKYFLTSFDASRIGGAEFALICAGVSVRDLVSEHDAAPDVKLFTTVEAADRWTRTAFPPPEPPAWDFPRRDAVIRSSSRILS